MCSCAPPRIRRTCYTASTAKWQVLETTQRARAYTYFRGLDVMLEHLDVVDFSLEPVMQIFAGPGDSRVLASLGMTNAMGSRTIGMGFRPVTR
jgi:hypothetical protein